MFNENAVEVLEVTTQCLSEIKHILGEVSDIFMDLNNSGNGVLHAQTTCITAALQQHYRQTPVSFGPFVAHLSGSQTHMLRYTQIRCRYLTYTLQLAYTIVL